MYRDLSIETVAAAFEISSCTLRTWIRRNTIRVERPRPSVLRMCGRDLAALGFVVGVRDRISRRKLRDLFCMVADAYQEQDRTGYRPVLVADLRGGWFRVFMQRPGPETVTPTDGTALWYLDSIAERFDRALAPAAPPPPGALKAELQTAGVAE